MTQTKNISFLDKETVEELEKQASEKHISSSALIRLYIWDHHKK